MACLINCRSCAKPVTSDWLDRWANGRTGWHEEGGNAGLKSHWPVDIGGNRVLVPLCGKSSDLLWLARRGHDVVGVELAEKAIREFFTDHDLDYQFESGRHFDRYRAKELPITLYRGDYFSFDAEPFDALYDRGALVALSAHLRPKYVARTKRLLRPHAVRLIITLEYDQDVVQGPPFSVLPSEVAAYWDDLLRVDDSDDFETCPPKFRAAGLKEIREVVWLANGVSPIR
jgi:thiopurine S-methyltransferase